MAIEHVPACRHRGQPTLAGEFVCSSPKLVLPGGLVTAETCREVCPFPDEDVDVDLAQSYRRALDAQASPPGLAQPASPVKVRLKPSDLAIAMITAPRPRNTVERSIWELGRAGFVQAINIFQEPGANLQPSAGLNITTNHRCLGPWRNWLSAATHVLEKTIAPFVLMTEDDIALAKCAALALQHAFDTLPYDSWGYASLYSPRYELRDRGQTEGWKEVVPRQPAWGALAYCFTRHSLQAVLNSAEVRAHQGDRDTDQTVTRAVVSLGLKCYLHVPSLCHHVGSGISSIGHDPSPESRALDYSPDYEGYVASTAEDHRPSRISQPVAEVKGQAVSVVVPTYNCAPFLRDCIASLARQTVPCDIIVVDDGSVDDTKGVLENLTDDVSFRYHAENLGSNAARNTGLRATKSEWVVFADADAVYQPRFLERLLEVASDDTSLVYCSWQRKDTESGGVETIAVQPYDPQQLWWNNYISACSLVRRRALPDSLTDRTAGVDHLEDWDLWLGLATSRIRAKAVPDVLFTAYERPEGKTAALRADRDYEARIIARLRRQYAPLIGLSTPIAVVIPAKDCIEVTERCLEHLAWYSGLPINVVYIDNGSQEQVPLQIAQTAERLGLSLAVIRCSTNEHFTRGVNRGIRFAASENVVCLNNDCFIGPGCLERMYWHLRRGEDGVAAVGPLTSDGGHQSVRLGQRRIHAGIEADAGSDYADVVTWSRRLDGPFRAREEEMVAFFCTMISADALRACGDLDETTREFECGLGADDEWCLRVRRHGWKVKLALDAYAAHLGGESFRQLGMDRDALQIPALDAFRRLHARWREAER